MTVTVFSAFHTNVFYAQPNTLIPSPLSSKVSHKARRSMKLSPSLFPLSLTRGEYVSDVVTFLVEVETKFLTVVLFAKRPVHGRCSNLYLLLGIAYLLNRIQLVDNRF